MNYQVIHGDILFTPDKNLLVANRDHYLIIADGQVVDILPNKPEHPEDYVYYDYTDHLIIPAFNDIHLHAVQYANRGVGLDKPLLPWLQQHTFPEEMKFSDLQYAKTIFQRLLHDLWEQGSLACCLYSSRHLEATQLLMDMVAGAGLEAYVGKVNMDRNAAEGLQEDTEDSLEQTKQWLQSYENKYPYVRPILTPRFVPSCSRRCLKELGRLAQEYNLPVQSHLNENLDEIAWVKQLYPDSKHYLDVYETNGLLRPGQTILAHCIYNQEEEIQLLLNKRILIAHCPTSNFNLSSGIMETVSLLDRGMSIGLGSDIAGGETLSIPKVMTTAIQASKILFSQGKSYRPLTFVEAFYLATKGGGSFFGNVGSFEPGQVFHALVICDQSDSDCCLHLSERLEKYIYTGRPEQIVRRFVRGQPIEDPFPIAQ